MHQKTSKTPFGT